MKDFFEKAYYYGPVFIQNIFVSLYGLKLYRERYSKNSNRYIDLLHRTDAYSVTQMKYFQTERFVALARHAITRVPYYRTLAADHGFKESDIQSLEDLKRFPILKKDSVRSNTKLFLSDKYRENRKPIELSTSGTTGTPLSVYCDPDSRTFHYAFFTRLRKWFNVKPRSRRATLFGRIIMLPKQNRPPFWRYDIAQNNLLMSSYHLSENNLIHYYHKLKAYKPEEVIGYPSSVYQIALYINNNHLEQLKPKIVITTAETLLSYQKKAIEAAFDAPLIDQYGCTEMTFFASMCEHGTMHSHPEHGIMETVDEIGNNVLGKPGNLVVTGLVNHTMPLIRYAIGDRITLATETERCGCGRAFPIITQVEGRIDDTLYRRDGTPIGRLDPVFKGGGRIVTAKIIQKETGNVDVLLQPADGYSEKDRAWLERELYKRMGDGIIIDIKIVPDIPKEKTGKFKAVESHYRI